ADIAAVAVLALADGPSCKHVGAKYHLTGPETTTAAQRAAVIGEAIGRPVRFEELSPSQALDQLLAFFPADVADGMLDAWAGMAEIPEAVTSTVADLTGRPARTFAQWAADHADDFR
nr:hypothetical protein [Micromonospora sp. DSM 115978]